MAGWDVGFWDVGVWEVLAGVRAWTRARAAVGGCGWGGFSRGVGWVGGSGVRGEGKSGEGGLTQARREVRSERMCEICMGAEVRVGLVR